MPSPLRPSLAVLLCAGVLAAPRARAEPPEPPPDATVASPADSGNAATPPPAPPAAQVNPGLSRFLAEFLTYDETTGRAYEGRARKPLTRHQLYERLGRPDLIAGMAQRLSRRRAFIVAGAGGGLLGLGVAAVSFATVPDLNSPACVADVVSYNETCVARNTTHQVVGGVGLVVGIASAAIFLGTAAAMDVEPLPRDELQQLVAGHNRTLLHRGQGAPASWRVFPMVGPQVAGLAAGGRF